MKKLILGLLTFDESSYELIFSNKKFNKISLLIFTLACFSGSIYPFLSDNNLSFNLIEFIIRFIGLIVQNLFIFAGTFFLGFIIFATNKRISERNHKPDNSYAKLTFMSHARLLSIVQFPTIIGMISIIPIFKSINFVSFIILVIVTIYLYALTVKSIFVSYGYNDIEQKRRQVNFIKSLLVVIFTQIPGAMIFNLFIVNLAISYIK